MSASVGWAALLGVRRFWVLWFWDPVGWSAHCLCLSGAVDHSQSESLLSLFQNYNKVVYCPICTKESNLTTNRNEKELK